MAAVDCSWVVGAMDNLWFHHIVLFPEPITSSLHCSECLKTPPPPISQSLPCSRSSSPTNSSSLLEDQISPASSEITQQNDSSNEDEEKERPTRVKNLHSKESRSHSSSPTTHKKRPKNRRSFTGSVRRLQKTMSCKSFLELELEELKGFTDLGFVFEKEELSPRMMSVVPGLQRLKLIAAKHVEEEEEEESIIVRPYLSEAWLIKEPNSPLLNFRMPRVSAAAEMKKHLRFWARTVASVVQHES